MHTTCLPNLCCNSVDDEGAGGREAATVGVLGQCTSLAHLDLSFYDIGAEGKRRLADVLVQYTSLTHLNY